MTAGRVVKNIPPKLVNFSAPLTPPAWMVCCPHDDASPHHDYCQQRGFPRLTSSGRAHPRTPPVRGFFYGKENL